jgi:RNA polymerase sigma-70 factor (ECF subfamily)
MKSANDECDIDELSSDAVSVSDHQRNFVEKLTNAQRLLYSYIYSLLGPGPNVDDVLQETNLSLWANLHMYDSARPFMPWAYQFAYNRVRAYRKGLSRSKLIFDETLLQLLHDDFVQHPLAGGTPLDALQDCVGRLPKREQELIKHRYEAGSSIPELARQLGETATNVATRLHRVRRGLGRCVESKLAIEVP